MTDHVWIALLVLAAVGSGLIGGLFFVFSNTIMRAFDRLPAAGAVAAMNSINRVILNPGFFLVFFGTALLCVVILIGVAARPDGRNEALAIAGAVFYLVGSIGVTMVFNVPLNNKLAAVSPSANDMETQWRNYRAPWTRWNHVRTVACLLAAAAFAHALVG
ncbi:MAG TPA: anthrone oxygenase family protein [Steroidobacter sp.]|uniref:anthrone oxygenase family protein n=1 Tax=Steroidobacter sp. TaxID=1978227 RepID=UPI002ED9DFE6